MPARLPRHFRTVLALLAVACAPAPRVVRPLELLQIRPANAQGVFLNEKLVLHFSTEIDPASVHEGSVNVQSEDGRKAKGSWLIQGRVLTFWPAPALRRDLSDGGYLPGSGYTLSLLGFPRPDGLRSRSGAFLERSVQFRFRTAGRAGSGREQLFEDSSLGVARPVVLLAADVDPTGDILLEGEEPLDPSSLTDEEFSLVPRGTSSAPRVGLRARLLENFDRYESPRRGTTLLALTPKQRLEPGSTYAIERVHGRVGLLDFGGNPVRSVVGSQPGRPPLVRVREQSSESDGFLTEEFANPELRSVEAVDDADGTALWTDSGRIEVRWPKAAGSGDDGAVELRGEETRRDLHATRLVSKRGDVCRMPASRGAVIWRSQGSIVIEGKLERSGGELPDPKTLGSAATSRRALGFDQVPPPSLSSWLDGEDTRARDVTVLVAGGDLVLAGEVEVHTNLVLIAGGHVRVRNKALPRALKLWVFSGFSRLSSSSGPLPDYRPIGAASPNVSMDLGAGAPPALVPDFLDPGVTNPLRVPLLYSVLSGPIPRAGAARRWFSARVDAHEGAGRVRVRYFADTDDPLDQGKLVDDPELLGGARTLRMRVDLELVPGANWDPPWVERVQLRWDPEQAP